MDSRDVRKKYEDTEAYCENGVLREGIRKIIFIADVRIQQGRLF